MTFLLWLYKFHIFKVHLLIKWKVSVSYQEGLQLTQLQWLLVTSLLD
jgi:hypothetical protein